MAHESAAGICEETLIEQFWPGIQMMLRRRVNPDDVRDATEDVLLTTLKALRAGSIRNSEALPGFVRTLTIRIAAERVAGYSRARCEADTSDLLSLAGALGRSPQQERDLLSLEDHQLAQLLLATLQPREREFLEKVTDRLPHGRCSETAPLTRRIVERIPNSEHQVRAVSSLSLSPCQR